MAGFSFSRERLFSSGFEQFLQRRGSSARHAGFDDCLESLCPEKTSSDHKKSSEVKDFRFTVVGHSDWRICGRVRGLAVADVDYDAKPERRDMALSTLPAPFSADKRFYNRFSGIGAGRPDFFDTICREIGEATEFLFAAEKLAIV